MDINTLSAIFGWCLLINWFIYSGNTLSFWLARDWWIRRACKNTGLQPEAVTAMFGGYMYMYRLLIIVFNFTPWLAFLIIRMTADGKAG